MLSQTPTQAGRSAFVRRPSPGPRTADISTNNRTNQLLQGLEVLGERGCRIRQPAERESIGRQQITEFVLNRRLGMGTTGTGPRGPPAIAAHAVRSRAICDRQPRQPGFDSQQRAAQPCRHDRSQPQVLCIRRSAAKLVRTSARSRRVAQCVLDAHAPRSAAAIQVIDLLGIDTHDPATGGVDGHQIPPHTSTPPAWACLEWGRCLPCRRFRPRSRRCCEKRRFSATIDSGIPK